MLKVVTIIGARPQIIKAAALSRAIRNNYSQKIKEFIVHTGQHYDENMSKVFFDELEIPVPDYNMNVGSDIHGKQTAKMISGIEEVLLKINPGLIILYGDTNSTLAGSVAAAKLHIPIVHIEAGMRSFNKKMPEEINRIVCDHCSTLLFSPTVTGFKNLVKEGFKPNTKPPYSIDNPHVFHCGDIMFDNSLYFAKKAEKNSSILKDYKLSENNYILATIHRDNNTDNPERLNAIFNSLNKISALDNIPVILPLHPRTSKLLKKNLTQEIYESVLSNRLFKIIKPVSFLDMILLEKKCMMVFTDSGGVQKEAYFFRKPCIILRKETEWIEIVENKAALLTDTNEKKIIKAYKHLSTLAPGQISAFPTVFGDGHASEFICNQLLNLTL
jgi:UDP-GlcNAc3NAcA epimerase